MHVIFSEFLISNKRNCRQRVFVGCFTHESRSAVVEQAFQEAKKMPPFFCDLETRINHPGEDTVPSPRQNAVHIFTTPTKTKNEKSLAPHPFFVPSLKSRRGFKRWILSAVRIYVGLRTVTFHISYPTRFCLHPLTSPVFLMMPLRESFHIWDIKYRNRMPGISTSVFVCRYRVQLGSHTCDIQLLPVVVTAVHGTRNEKRD